MIVFKVNFYQNKICKINLIENLFCQCYPTCTLYSFIYKVSTHIVILIIKIFKEK